MIISHKLELKDKLELKHWVTKVSVPINIIIINLWYIMQGGWTHSSWPRDATRGPLWGPGPQSMSPTACPQGQLTLATAASITFLRQRRSCASGMALGFLLLSAQRPGTQTEHQIELFLHMHELEALLGQGRLLRVNMVRARGRQLPLALAIIIAMAELRGSPAIRHSKAYLAKRAAAAAVAARLHAARNGSRIATSKGRVESVNNLPYLVCDSPPHEPANTMIQDSARVHMQPARGSQKRDQPSRDPRSVFGGGGASKYPQGIVSVLKSMRREEEAAADASAPKLPEDITVTAKMCDTQYGAMAYRTIQGNETSGLDVVFVHGLGTDGSNCQPPAEAVQPATWNQGLRGVRIGRRWIIPDLIGHGASCISHDPYAYKMESQAKAILRVLRAEGTTRCAIIAHSMGAVVAVSLCELCYQHNISVCLLISCEGNLDTRDDAFHARALFQGIMHKELWVRDPSHQQSAVMYWSIVWMMSECSRGLLLQRLAALSNGHLLALALEGTDGGAEGAVGGDGAGDRTGTAVGAATRSFTEGCIPEEEEDGVRTRYTNSSVGPLRTHVKFVYGTNRRRDTGGRRRESSEALLERNGWEISYCEGGGHRMHWDGGRDNFWRMVCAALSENEQARG